MLPEHSQLTCSFVCVACICSISSSQYWNCIPEQRRSKESLSEDPEGACCFFELDDAISCLSCSYEAKLAKVVTG